MSDEERARVEIVDVCRRLYEKGWVANHDGNVSVRVCENRIVTTPTAVSKGDIRPEMLIVVDPNGQKLEGTRKPFSELSLHLRAYRDRPDVKAVVHAHPVTTTGFSVAGIDIDPTFMPEAVVSLGDRIPTSPPALPFGEEGAAPLEGLLEDYDAIVMANHGVLTLGGDVWTAFLRLELVEHLARIQLVAQQLGRMNRLSGEQIAALLERRTKAGLGPEARGRGRAAGSSWGSAAGSGGTSSAPGGSSGASWGGSTGASSGGSGTSSWGGSSSPTFTVPDGPANSAWSGPYVSPCSGERVEPASPAQLSATAARIPSNEELQQLLAREVTRILGKTSG